MTEDSIGYFIQSVTFVGEMLICNANDWISVGNQQYITRLACSMKGAVRTWSELYSSNDFEWMV